jgi:hypothetical protein
MCTLWVSVCDFVVGPVITWCHWRITRPVGADVTRQLGQSKTKSKELLVIGLSSPTVANSASCELAALSYQASRGGALRAILEGSKRLGHKADFALSSG